MRQAIVVKHWLLKGSAAPFRSDRWPLRLVDRGDDNPFGSDVQILAMHL